MTPSKHWGYCSKLLFEIVLQGLFGLLGLDTGVAWLRAGVTFLLERAGGLALLFGLYLAFFVVLNSLLLGGLLFAGHFVPKAKIGLIIIFDL